MSRSIRRRLRWVEEDIENKRPHHTFFAECKKNGRLVPPDYSVLTSGRLTRIGITGELEVTLSVNNVEKGVYATSARIIPSIDVYEDDVVSFKVTKSSKGGTIGMLIEIDEYEAGYEDGVPYSNYY